MIKEKKIFIPAEKIKVKGDIESYNSAKHRYPVVTKCFICNQSFETSYEYESHSMVITNKSVSGWKYNDSKHWKEETVNKVCYLNCGYKETKKNTVSESGHSFTISYGSWTAGSDGYYHRTKTSTCYCGYTKLENERGGLVHTHSWVTSYGNWYDYNNTYHARSKWEYCNGTPSPCSETISLADDYEYHNSNGRRNETEISGWVFNDNGNGKKDGNETEHWKNRVIYGIAYCSVCNHLMNRQITGTEIINREPHAFNALSSDRTGYRKFGCSVCGYYYYEPIEYSVVFDGNLGTVSGNNKSIRYEDTVSLPNVSREGYTFLGWQPYSGSTSYTCSTNTDPSSSVAVRLPAGTSLRNLTTNDRSTVTFVAIWKHVNPVITKEIGFRGNYVYSDIPLSGYPVYYLKGSSPYTPTINFSIRTPSYTTVDYYRVSDAGTVYDKSNGLSYSLVQAGGDYKKTEIFTNSSVSVSGETGTSRILTSSWRYTDRWNDRHTSKNEVITDSQSYQLVFDREAPRLDFTGTNDFKAIYEANGKDSEALNGKTSHYIARDNPLSGNNYFVGLDSTKTTVKITNRKSGAERSLTGTPHIDAYGRIDYIDFGNVTVNTSENLFKNGFSIEVHLEDKLGNVTEYIDNFGDLQIKITSIGSYTDRVAKSNFCLGEAVYVTATILGGADSVQSLFTPSMTPLNVFREGTYDSVVGTVHSEDLSTVNVIYTEYKNKCEVVYVFLIPESNASSNYTLSLIAEHDGVRKQDGIGFTVDLTKSIHDGVHTVIVDQ
ncbi:MAG: InlB B-repeat-containing protein [Lachnospiraceae bacterium]|nr:InlB B-repeat-containing protein [Lachnospiraceae bacterium]